MEDDKKITYFGETDFRNARTKFGIRRRDRTRHMYVIGKTGMGKSTLLENMAIQDIQGGEGLCFIDPHGSAAEKLIEYVPEHRIKDVIYFAPFDLDNPISFNVLEVIDEERKHLIGAGLMNAFKKAFVDGDGKSTFSGRMEYILSMTLLALLDNPGETLLGVNRMYSDKDYRKKIVSNIKDPSVKTFWTDEYAKYSEKVAMEATASIQNKIGQFTANPLIRNLLGQRESSFDFRKVMDDKKILIVNLSKGKMGPDNMRLIGGMVVTKIYLAAMSRADASAKELKELAPFYLYVDEFQNFANESFAEILSESRKYNLALTVANQYIDQMTEAVRGAILGNVGSMITFRIGAPDAEIMEKEFTPYFTAEDLVNLGFTQVYLKLMIDGIGSQPFSCTSMGPLPPLPRSFEQEIIENSRQMYCQPRVAVEAAIAEWFAPVDRFAGRPESEVDSDRPAYSPKPQGEYRSGPKPEYKTSSGDRTYDSKKPNPNYLGNKPRGSEAYTKPKEYSERRETRPVQSTATVANTNESPKPAAATPRMVRNEFTAEKPRSPVATDQNKRQQSTQAKEATKNPETDSNLKSIIQKIQQGELVEVQSTKYIQSDKKVPNERSDQSNSSTHSRVERDNRMPLSVISKEKTPFESQNKNSLKDAIEKAMQESKKENSQEDKQGNNKEQKTSTDTPSTTSTANTVRATNTNDVLNTTNSTKQAEYKEAEPKAEVPESVLRDLLADI
jgi:hypothetical protein